MAIIQFIPRVSHHDRDTVSFQVNFDAYRVFTGYDIGCKQSVQLQNNLKFHFDKQISVRLQRKNAYRGLRRRDVACNSNVLAPLVTSLTL